MDVRVSSLDEVYLLHGGLLFIELQLVGSEIVVVWIPTPTAPRHPAGEGGGGQADRSPDSVHTSDAAQAIFSLIAQLQISTGLPNVHLYR